MYSICYYEIFICFLFQLISVDPVIGTCYYDNANYYSCYTNVGSIVGAVIGCLFGLAILVVIVIVICSYVKTKGIRGHVVRPTNISTVNNNYTLQQQTAQQPPPYNGYQYTQPPDGSMYPPPPNMAYPPPPPNYGPPPSYPGNQQYDIKSS